MNIVSHFKIYFVMLQLHVNNKQLEMWASAQRDGRPAEYRWRPLFNAAKFERLMKKTKNKNRDAQKKRTSHKASDLSATG